LTRPKICLQFLLIFDSQFSLLVMGNVELELCWAKTDRGSTPHPFLIAMV
jgi:hypothetical protein